MTSERLRAAARWRKAFLLSAEMDGERMTFLEKLFGGGADFSKQISTRAVAWLLANASGVRGETLDFVEPGARMSMASSMFIANALAEFDDPALGILFGRGHGHAFLRVAHLQKVAQRHAGTIRDARDLAAAFRAEGFRVKRVEYLSFE